MNNIIYFKPKSSEPHELHIKKPGGFWGVTDVSILTSTCGQVWKCRDSGKKWSSGLKKRWH